MSVSSRFFPIALLSASLVLPISTALADDVGDAIAAAGSAYKSGDLSTAKQQLDLASQLIAQKTADVLVTALPKALAGWKAGDPDTTAGGGLGFGFGVTQATRS